VAIGKRQPEIGNLALAILRIFQEQQSRRWRR
jgi:hypothetical protein